jgi:(2Fe-2S) ferredoxin
MGGRAKPLYRCLVEQLARIEEQSGIVVKLETANCLSMCGTGPNLIIYPQAQAVHALDCEKLRELIATLWP